MTYMYIIPTNLCTVLKDRLLLVMSPRLVIGILLQSFIAITFQIIMSSSLAEIHYWVGLKSCGNNQIFYLENLYFLEQFGENCYFGGSMFTPGPKLPNSSSSTFL